MEDPQPIRVARHQAAIDPIIRKATVPWRHIALLMTPVILSGGNLIAAHFEKLRGLKVAVNKYHALEGRGLAYRDAALRTGKNRGEARYAALMAEGTNESLRAIATGKKEGETRDNQGKLGGAIPIALSENFLPQLFGDTPEFQTTAQQIAQIEMGLQTGIYLKVDPRSGGIETLKINPDQVFDAEFDRQARTAQQLRSDIFLLKEKMIDRGARTMITMTGTMPCKTPEK